MNHIRCSRRLIANSSTCPFASQSATNCAVLYRVTPDFGETSNSTYDSEFVMVLVIHYDYPYMMRIEVRKTELVVGFAFEHLPVQRLKIYIGERSHK